MKDKRIHIRASEEFLEMLEYLQRINGYKNLSEAIRKTIEKEYRKEKEQNDIDFERKIRAMFADIWDCEINHPKYQDTVGELMKSVINVQKTQFAKNWD